MATCNLSTPMICIIWSNGLIKLISDMEVKAWVKRFFVFFFLLDLPVNLAASYCCAAKKKNQYVSLITWFQKQLFNNPFVRAPSDRASCQRCTVSHLATGHSSWLFEMIMRSQCQAVLTLGTQTGEEEQLHFSGSLSPCCIKNLRRKWNKKNMPPSSIDSLG